ncbi:MAG: phosphomethylpyrimidine synthase ThiC [Methanomicrobiales archaeon]|nr:phosphomethylpyrimidine synthase ThiC [Methanomicrobiales archaeon]
MSTLIDEIRNGVVPLPVARVARDEGIDPGQLCRSITEGSAVVMQRGERCTGIGRGLATKINVNLGTSTGKISVDDEIRKAQIAEHFGAHTISDLSMGGDISLIRKNIFTSTTLPITTVPVYQAVAEHGLGDLTAEDILSMLELQAQEGVSSVVVHGVSRAMLGRYHKKERVLGMVSKGGSITSAFMLMHECENPFLEQFDRVLATCRKHDIVLSLGNTARSGCIHDLMDDFMRAEVEQNVKLAQQAQAAGVQVIVEGCGGHIRSDRIPEYIRYYKDRSVFPLFVAGPLPTDIAVGYDHIAGACGGSAAAAAGADYLCYITPAEHLGLPSPEAVKEGLIAFRIAAHIGDTVKYGRDATDREVALHRAALDQEGQIRCAMDPERARNLADEGEECTMCGKFCAIKMMRDL